MESICQEIGVPRKQIKKTKRSDRFIVIVHRAWLSCLVQEKCVAKFPSHPGFDEWPTTDDGCGRDWTRTYFVVSITSIWHFHRSSLILRNFDRRTKSWHTKWFHCPVVAKIVPTLTRCWILHIYCNTFRCRIIGICGKTPTKNMRDSNPKCWRKNR